MRSSQPQVILGDPITGAGSDNLRQAFGKLNEHSHLVASSTNPLTKGIMPGEAVKLISNCQVDLLQANTTVQSLSSTQMVMTQPATRTALCSLQIGTRIVDHCLTTKDSNVVIFLPMAGFISGTLYTGLVSRPVTLTLQVQNGSYPLLLRSPWRGVLERAVITTVGSGNLTAELLINNRSISNSLISSAPTTLNFEDTANNRVGFVEDDSVYVRVSGVLTGTPILHVSLYILVVDPSSTVAVRQSAEAVTFPPDYDFMIID